MVFSYLIFFILLAACLLAIKKWEFLKIEGLNTTWLSVGFCIKLIMGISLWFIYTYYYADRANADIYKYYDDALIILKQTDGNWFMRFQFLSGFVSNENEFQQIIKETLHWDRSSTEPFNDNPVMIRLNLLILFLSNGLFHIHTLIFTFLSFLGSLALIKFIRNYSSIPSKILFAILFLVPSIIFWNSGVLKEAWLFFCLGFFLYFFHQLMTSQKLIDLIGLVIFGVLLFYIKTYILICLIPALLFIRLDFIFNWKNKILAFIITQLSILILVFSNFYQDIFNVIKNKKDDFIQLAIDTNANSLIDTISYQKLSEIIYEIPFALFTVLYRPGIWEISGIFSLISAIENIALLVILILPLFFYRKPSSRELSLILFCLSFTLILGILIGFTTPILGAIVRYKTPILPFYLLIVFSFIDIKKVPYLKKIYETN